MNHDIDLVICGQCDMKGGPICIDAARMRHVLRKAN